MPMKEVERTEQAKECKHGSFTCDKCQWFGGYAKPAQTLPLATVSMGPQPGTFAVAYAAPRPGDWPATKDFQRTTPDYMALALEVSKLRDEIQALKRHQEAFLLSMTKKATKRTKSKKK